MHSIYYLRDYYIRFINSIDKDIEMYEDALEDIYKAKMDLVKIFDDNRIILDEYFGIDFDKFYTELIECQYNPKKQLLKYVQELSDADWDRELNKLLIQLKRYCVTLEQEYKYKTLIRYAHKRRLLNYSDYIVYVRKFYRELQRHLLNGEGVRFSNGLGILRFDYTKITGNGRLKFMIDSRQTRLNKEELIRRGLNPYDKKVDAFCKENNIPYDGRAYVVYTDRDFFYQLKFRNGAVWRGGLLEFQPANYVHLLYKGMSFDEIAEKYCNSFEDIVNLQVDVKTKLSLLLRRYPTYYLKFLRNEKKPAYEYRKNNRKN